MNDRFWDLIGTGSATLSGLAFISSSFYYKRLNEKSEEYLRRGFVSMPSIALSRFGLAWTLLLSPFFGGLALCSTNLWASFPLAIISIGAGWGASCAWRAPRTTRPQKVLIATSFFLTTAACIVTLVAKSFTIDLSFPTVLECSFLASLLLGLYSVPLSLEWLDRHGSFMRPKEGRDLTKETTTFMNQLQGDLSIAQETYDRSLSLLGKFKAHFRSAMVERELVEATQNFKGLKNRVRTVDELVATIHHDNKRKRILNQPDLDLLLAERRDLSDDIQDFTKGLEGFLSDLEVAETKKPLE
ncbi:MAG TPA: hypothetical protein VGS22_18785 [Thermoanaerobaculia bacterium]|jgi:hypothetical protein|nr:hypothetical protein [Thermoanaerobaculia bacterium]